MQIHFSKYQGAGNDFIVINNIDDMYHLTEKIRQKLCDRRFGVGGDGVLEIKSSETADFGVLYYNANGKAGSLCGNACRCAIAFALKIGINNSRNNFDKPNKRDLNVNAQNINGNQNNTIHLEDSQDETEAKNSYYETVSNHAMKRGGNSGCDTDETYPRFKFEAYDGIHVGGVSLRPHNAFRHRGYEYFVVFKNMPLDGVKIYDNGEMFLDTGSPHHIRFVSQDVGNVNVFSLGRELRYGFYGDKGSNINFVSTENPSPPAGSEGGNRLETKGCNQISNPDPSVVVNGEDKSSDIVKTDIIKGQNSEDPGRLNTGILRARTYERGVEDETYACGTGAVAIAVADYIRTKSSLPCLDKANEGIEQGETISRLDGDSVVMSNQNGAKTKRISFVKRVIKMRGGNLKVQFKVNELETSPVAYDVCLSGPAELVFEGVYDA